MRLYRIRPEDLGSLFGQPRSDLLSVLALPNSRWSAASVRSLVALAPRGLLLWTFTRVMTQGDPLWKGRLDSPPTPKLFGRWPALDLHTVVKSEHTLCGKLFVLGFCRLLPDELPGYRSDLASFMNSVQYANASLMVFCHRDDGLSAVCQGRVLESLQTLAKLRALACPSQEEWETRSKAKQQATSEIASSVTSEGAIVAFPISDVNTLNGLVLVSRLGEGSREMEATSASPAPEGWTQQWDSRLLE